MAFSSQAFTAPPVKPKMGRTTVSSSIFRGGSATTKMPKMAFTSFGRRTNPNNLPNKTDFEETLIETNNLLRDISNQIAADFAYRIAAQKESEKKIRAETEQKRRSRKEALLEGGKKIGRATSSVISKITAPAKSFLDKVFGFIGSVFQGFLASEALKWLADEKNQEKVGKVFKFIEKNWKILLGIAGGIVGGIVVAKVFSKLYTMYRITRGLLRLVGIGRGRGRGGDTIQDGGRPGRGGLIRRADGSRRGVKVFQTTKEFSRRSALGGSVKYTKDVIGRSKNPLAKLLQFAQVNIVRSASKFFRKSGLKLLTKALRPFLKRIPIIGALLDFGISIALGESVGRAGAKAVGALLGGIVGSALGPLGSFGGAVAGDMLGAALFDMFTGGQANGMNSGGIVPGGGPNKDSVLTYLTPGEGVVPREMMDDKMYGPFVKDIIYNSGSLYNAMVFALARLDKNADDFSKINSKFGEILDEYKKICEVGSGSVMGTGSGSVTSAAPKTQVKPTPSSSSSGITPPSQVNSGGNMAPTVLPPIIQKDGQQKSQQIDADNSFAKYAPIDMSNPYLAYVKKEFGILGV